MHVWLCGCAPVSGSSVASAIHPCFRKLCDSTLSTARPEMNAGFDRATLAAASPPGRRSSLPPGYRVPGAAHLVMTGLDFEPMWKRLGAPTVPCDTCSPPCVVHRNVWPELVRSADFLFLQQQQPLRVAYNNGNPRVAYNNKTGARGQVLLSTNNGDHLYGLSQQEQRLLAGLYIAGIRRTL